MDFSRYIASSGFNLDNSMRVKLLPEIDDFVPPKPVKTGTTIAGIVFRDGVVLGADSRCTSGATVSDKNCSKIHFMANHIYCCGTGIAADVNRATDVIKSEIELQTLNTGRQVPVVSVERLLKQMLFRFRGQINAGFVLGGVDKHGPHIYFIHPCGSTAKLPYATMGSGACAAMAVFEDRWKCDMSEKYAKELVCDAIKAGVFNDLCSGSNVDLCVIRKDCSEYLRNYKILNQKGQRKLDYRVKPGTTPVLHTTIQNMRISECVHVIPMDT